MALGLNHVLLIGTLLRDADLRYTPAGLAVLRLDLGGDDHLFDDAGELRARPWYQRATVFGAQAERIVDHVRAGTPLWLEGHLEARVYETEEGEKRRTLDVVAGRAELLTIGARDPEDAFAVDARDQPRLRDAVNRVRLIGNLARDAEARRTEAGHPLARFALAVRARGEGNGDPHFIEVQAWREGADACRGLAKGDPAYLEGRLVTDAWTDAEGRRRYATRVEAHRIERILRLPRASKPDDAAAVPPQQQPVGAETTATA